MTATGKLLAIALLSATPALGNLVVNPNFNMGPDNLYGYEAYGFWVKGAASFGSPWALADAPVTADGSGTAVFRMNTQLALADPFWTGATQIMTFQQNFWTPDNNVSVTPTVDLYDTIIQFTGKAVVTEAYAPGNQGLVFIQFLDQSWNAVYLNAIDVSTLPPSGEFSITAATPSGGLNIIQIGARNIGIEGTAGAMTLSDFRLTIVPEPAAYPLIAAVLSLCALALRRRRQGR